MTGSAADKRFNEFSTELAMRVVDNPGVVFKANRGACITGLVGRQYDEASADGKFDLGRVCLSLVEKSAEFQLDPSKLKADPDKAILGAYKEVLDRNQMNATFTQAQRLLNALNDFATHPDTKDTSGLGFQWSDQPNARPLHALPSGTIDAGFSQAIQDFQKTGVLPPEPKAKDDALLENARICYANRGTLEACHATGKALGAKYLRKTSRVS